MVGHQAATVQRIALGADHDGRLSGIRHDSVNPTSVFDDYVEYAALASRHLWRASGGISTSHRVVHVNRNSPVVLRAPMEAQGGATSSDKAWQQRSSRTGDGREVDEISSARIAHLARHGRNYGTVTGSVTVDMATVRRRKREMVERQIARHSRRRVAKGSDVNAEIGRLYG
jgi:hypothetical protein